MISQRKIIVRSPWGGGLAVAGLSAALMIVTEPGLSIVWDEGATLYRLVRIRAWLGGLCDPAGFASSWQHNSAGHTKARCLELIDENSAPRGSELNTREKLLKPAIIRWFWAFAREEPHGHPPFYALIALLGDVIAPAWEELPRARLGTMLVFSLASGMIYGFLARLCGAQAALVGACAWVFQPQMFGFGHYATYDSLLTSLWVMSVFAFSRAVESCRAAGTSGLRWGWMLVFGLLCGWAADTKLTGWFLPLPFILWTAIRRDRHGGFALAVGLPIALLTLYLFNPVWWFEPITGVVRFLQSNLSRGTTIPIRVLFLGRFYVTPNESLPWYNTLVWTLFATPVGFLLLAVVGIGWGVRYWHAVPVGGIVACNFLFLLILRALPHTPGHDGIRLFLPAFGLLSVAAGLGAGAVLRRYGGRGTVVCLAAVAEGVVSVALMMPVPLSHISPIVGGLPGATALGMEPTYYWDSFTVDALEWVNRNTAPGQKVRFANSYPLSWVYLRETGKLKPGIRWDDPGEYAWYVVQNRPGLLLPIDRGLISAGKPAMVVTKMGAPLLWIFPYSRVVDWAREHSKPAMRDDRG
jgi:4-amino-4-deoxy-L-arabinose transferase-like glycosyltransferase